MQTFLPILLWQFGMWSGGHGGGTAERWVSRAFSYTEEQTPPGRLVSDLPRQEMRFKLVTAVNSTWLILKFTVTFTGCSVHFKIDQDLYSRFTWYFCSQRHGWEGDESLVLRLRSVQAAWCLQGYQRNSFWRVFENKTHPPQSEMLGF